VELRAFLLAHKVDTRQHVKSCAALILGIQPRVKSHRSSYTGLYPVILHGVVSGDTTPCRMIGVTLHSLMGALTFGIIHSESHYQKRRSEESDETAVSICGKCLLGDRSRSDFGGYHA